MRLKKLIIIMSLMSAPLMAQTTPNLGLTLPVQGQQNWGNIINADLTIIDTFAGTSPTLPSSGTGILFGLTPTTTRFSTFSDVVTIFGGGSCSGFLKSDGTCENLSPGLTSFTVGNLFPLFTATLGADPTTSPVLSFNLSTAAANSVFGNFSGSSSTPTFNASPVFSAANLTNFPTFNQNTTGNAATATALSSVPVLCTVAGQFPKGILANGNATGCTAASPGGITSIGITTPSYFTVSGSPLTTNGTIAISATTGLTANSFLATPNGSTGALAVRTIVGADLPLATTSLFGAVKPDGTSITISGGVISSVGSGGVASINTVSGAFVFSGAGVSCTSTTCTFSGSGTGIGSIAWTIPSWLTATPSTISASGTQAFAPTTGQASHQVIGTCGTGTTFAPCSLVPGDLPIGSAIAVGAVSADNVGIAINGGGQLSLKDQIGGVDLIGHNSSGVAIGYAPNSVITLTGGAVQIIGWNGVTVSGLATGILKNTTGTGVPSIATAGTDYLTPTGSAVGLSKASAAAFGVSECDGTTITCSGGIFVATAGGISGLTSGFIPLAGSSSTITANSHLNDGVTTAGVLTATEPLAINDGSGQGGTWSPFEGTAPSGVASTDIVWADATSHRLRMNNNNGTTVNVAGSLNGTTGTVTGTSLSSSCDSGTATVTGAVVGQPVQVSSTTGADVGGAFNLRASVTSSNTVTVFVCGTGTPASLAYNVSVNQ